MKTLKILSIAIASLMLCSIAVDAQSNRQEQAPTDTLTVIVNRANGGDAEAQNVLGLWYYTGTKVKQDYDRALKYWAAAAAQDYAEAIGNMALCYQLGRGIQADSLKATQLYMKSIQKGNGKLLAQHDRLARENENMFSCMLLYDIYFNAKAGQARNTEKAKEYLTIAANTGNEKCQVKLAMLLLNEKNMEEAVKWFKILSDRGNVTGHYYYGYMLFKGMGITQDKTWGIEFLKRASERGLNSADRMLGKIYFEGDGVEQDYSRAVIYLQRAAAKNTGESQLLLAKCYATGNGVQQDYDRATCWLAEAFANKQDLAVREWLNNGAGDALKYYIDGLKKYEVDNQTDEAVRLFKQAEKAHNVEGTTMQGIILLTKAMGQEAGAQANAKKAFKLLTKAAGQSAAAMTALAPMYEMGLAVERNESTARELIIKAADAGNSTALCAAGDLYFNGDGVSQDYVKAAEYYLRAEQQCGLTALSAKNLAKCYKMEISALPDIENKAVRMAALNNLADNTHLSDMLKAL